MGMVRMRVTRQETGTGKREEPTGICVVELSVLKWSNLKTAICVMQPEVVVPGSAGRQASVAGGGGG